MITITDNQILLIFLLLLSGVFYLFSIIVARSRMITDNDDRIMVGVLVFFGSLFLFLGLNAEFQWIIVK